MELDRALSLLGLAHDCSRDGLNESFRRLAKKYHPDSNRGSESWAHRMMTELNLAYETVLTFLDGAGGGRGAGSPAAAMRPSGFQVRFSRSVTRVLDGVYTYYQYGLENVRLRRDGVRTFRYRDTLRYLREGLANLKKLEGFASSDAGAVRLQVFTDFTEIFIQNALIDRHVAASPSAYESRAYRHYLSGGESLDYAIKDALFGDEMIQVRRGSYHQMLAQSREELMIVIREYARSTWVGQTLVKLALQGVFSRVLELLQKMRH